VLEESTASVVELVDLIVGPVVTPGFAVVVGVVEIAVGSLMIIVVSGFAVAVEVSGVDSIERRVVLEESNAFPLELVVGTLVGLFVIIDSTVVMMGSLMTIFEVVIEWPILSVVVGTFVVSMVGLVEMDADVVDSITPVVVVILGDAAVYIAEKRNSVGAPVEA